MRRMRRGGCCGSTRRSPTTSRSPMRSTRPGSDGLSLVPPLHRPLGRGGSGRRGGSVVFLELRLTPLVAALVVGQAAVAWLQCWFFLVMLLFALFPSGRRQAQDAPHPGRYAPGGPLQWHFQGWFSWLQYTSRCALWYCKGWYCW